MSLSFGWLFEQGGETLVAGSLLLSAVMAVWAFSYRRLYLRIRDEQHNSADLIENLSEGIYRATPNGSMLSANRALVQLNGFESEEEMLAGVKNIETEWYVDPTRRATFQAILRRDGKVENFVSEIRRYKTRERIWITESARLVRHRTSGKPLYHEGSVREITETVKRLQLEERYQKLTQQLPGALFQFVAHANGDMSVPYVSPGILGITGASAEEHAAHPSLIGELIHPEDRRGFKETSVAASATLQPWDYEFRLRPRDGEEKWVRITARLERNDGDLIWHGYLADISRRKRQELALEQLAYYDPLTKLPNRRKFFSRMGEATAGCARCGRQGALLFIDLDNFKTLNDTQGHDIGDAFLIQVAERLRRCTASAEMVARIGGDEFVLVLDDAGANAAEATLRAITTGNRILAEMRGGFDLGALHHVASASIGVVVFDGSEERTDEILKRADIAMYQAKSAGRNGLALFDPASLNRESERYRMVTDLRGALKTGQLELHFQPQVDHHGAITGAEGLVRWNHPKLGMIYPDQFVTLSEQFGLNDELSRCVFTRGIEMLAEWQSKRDTAHLRLALNVSLQSFGSEVFIPMIRELVAGHQVDAEKLTFELTEHVMAKNEKRVAERMQEAKQLGVRISLDDFGTGYSSLAYLKRLPIDEIKIAGNFVADIESSESDRGLVKTILSMARTLRLTTVAEHVENIRQEAFLRAFGCDMFQGYLYSRALPAADFLALLNTWKTPHHTLRLRQLG